MIAVAISAVFAAVLGYAAWRLSRQIDKPKPADTTAIQQALVALGYNEREAKAATKGIPKGTEVGEGVRLALKNLLK